MRRWRVRDDAGVGKTALLEYGIESASDLRFMRAVESSPRWTCRLPQCISSLLDRLERLPGLQRDALEITVGLTAGLCQTGPSSATRS